ncbi:hypothetical protein TR51_12485 [Kitasatospora griseola]|uniref:Uncharacterized protein n=1 Tax=Kitasatospora griseola TaxID=2064 RepID=A0A0D0P062_KITGR|nr:hypothetical protein [Kitasatospora griseola]KIQ64906.1 hypothetical protein TR51_12485 [Kitasatospora griseola]
MSYTTITSPPSAPSETVKCSNPPRPGRGSGPRSRRARASISGAVTAAEAARISRSWTVHGLRSAHSTTPNTTVYESAAAPTSGPDPSAARYSAGLSRRSAVP